MNQFFTRLLSGAALVLLLGLAYSCHYPELFSLLLIACLGIILALEWPKCGPAILTPWFPITPFLVLIYLNQSSTYHHLVLLIFASSMLFDVGAYLIGSRCGQWKLAPSISPNKTWEGFAGGVLFSFLIVLLNPLRHLFMAHPVWTACFILLIDITALMGDLFVSHLKRRAQIKDCGTILPGHGGLLDRFDSILFVTIIFFLFRRSLSLP
ncbi:MAG: Phosphatidate cytidylyltransferase [candidate division TM6 bacterium GW2011_GWE2_42_60]|nr:MAG: Phosphatidate cytidylyltransferase [candidate division TM6 bacterium GW2011_GWE2_42_60]HBY05661.1 hypothetical protein [Candidatus Dependentiae bacterium]